MCKDQLILRYLQNSDLVLVGIYHSRLRETQGQIFLDYLIYIQVFIIKLKRLVK